jgi:Lar family restriction alleviation protein
MELKPCPFCGSDKAELANVTPNEVQFVYCPKCEAAGPATFLTKDAAIIEWNKRHVSDVCGVEGHADDG